MIKRRGIWVQGSDEQLQWGCWQETLRTGQQLGSKKQSPAVSRSCLKDSKERWEIHDFFPTIAKCTLRVFWAPKPWSKFSGLTKRGVVCALVLEITALFSCVWACSRWIVREGLVLAVLECCRVLREAAASWPGSAGGTCSTTESQNSQKPSWCCTSWASEHVLPLS